MKKSPLRKQAQKALWKRFYELTGKDISEKGYVKRVEDNLLSGVKLEMFQDDLKGGSGNELETKFMAVHSSSALAVNTFSPFKKEPNKLVLAGKTGFSTIQFEKQCSTGLGGTPPNLDLLAESETDIVGVESKFLEYLTPKKPHFADSYNRKNLPQAEDCWLALIDELKDSGPQYLDAAQLVKHYLGLRKQYPKKDITLHYVFWEPHNSKEFGCFKQHRKEIDVFTKKVKDSEISFIAENYSELWDGLSKRHLMEEHVDNLINRYQVMIAQ